MDKFEVLDIKSHQFASIYCLNSDRQLLHIRGRRLSTVENIRSIPFWGSREHDQEVSYSTHFSQMRDDLTACATALGIPETGVLKLFALAHMRYPQVAESGFREKYFVGNYHYNQRWWNSALLPQSTSVEKGTMCTGAQ